MTFSTFSAHFFLASWKAINKILCNNLWWSFTFFPPQQLTSQKFWYHSCVLGLPSSSNVEMIVAWASTNFFLVVVLVTHSSTTIFNLFSLFVELMPITTPRIVASSIYLPNFSTIRAHVGPSWNCPKLRVFWLLLIIHLCAHRTHVAASTLCATSTLAA